MERGSESNQAFMAKVVEGLALAKAQSDTYLTPLVEVRKAQLSGTSGLVNKGKHEGMEIN